MPHSNSSLVHLKKDSFLFLEGDQDSDLYLIHSGKILVFVTKRSEVIPLAYLGPGEFLGELSFFDKNPRSANVIAVDPTDVIRIPVSEINKLMPSWMILVAKFLIYRIRNIDEIIKSHGIRKKNAETMTPLPIQEQTRLFQLFKNHRAI